MRPYGFYFTQFPCFKCHSFPILFLKIKDSSYEVEICTSDVPGKIKSNNWWRRHKATHAISLYFTGQRLIFVDVIKCKN